MNKRIKKYGILFLKFTVSILILYFLFHKIQLQEVLLEMQKIPILLICLLLFTALIKQIIEILNWYFMLSINPSFKANIKTIIRSHFIGQSLRFLVPGGHAVVGKMFFIENSKKASFLSIGVEKFFQIWIVSFFAAVSSLFYFHEFKILVRIIALTFIILLPFLLYIFKFFWKRAKHIYFNQYRSILPKIMISQISYMLITITQYYILLQFFDNLSFKHTFVSVPLILFANVIPITYAGLGLRESFAITVLSRYSINPVYAVSVSLIVFIFNTFLPAVAGIFFWVKKK